MDERARRLAENEILFRAVNERIEEISADLVASDPSEPQVLDFLCECHDPECRERLPLTRGEYERVRADGRRFLVAPDDAHVTPAVEHVVDRSTRYWVVEKRDAAGEIAEAADPRD